MLANSRNPIPDKRRMPGRNRIAIVRRVVMAAGPGLRLPLIILACTGFPGCSPDTRPQAVKHEPPAKVQSPPQEAGLTTITLTPQAEQRLGIRTVSVRYEKVSDTRTYGGEVMVPPGRSVTVSAPVAGMLAAAGVDELPPAGRPVTRGRVLFRLLPLERDLRGRNLLAAAEENLAAAEARLQAARLSLARAEQLLRDRAGSVRSLEQAQAELAQAEAARSGAQAQVDYLKSAPLEAGEGLEIKAPRDAVMLRTYVAVGQTVAAGAPLFEMESLDPVWIRVPVYVGELSSIVSGRAAAVHELGAIPGSATRLANPVAAPPSADPNAAAVDLYFELANPNRALRPGQRVGVTLALRGEEEGLVVPWSAIIHDIHGGTWVYENSAPQTYLRRRVEVRFVAGANAVLSRGPAPGGQVVSVGAAELFGTEFGTGK